MRLVERNKTTVYYRLYQGMELVVDEQGYETGEKVVAYDDPVAIRVNVSPATGHSSIEQFGTLEGYDKVIVTEDMTCPIDEHSVLYVDSEPVTDEEGNVTNAYDYIVKRVARSLNLISYAIAKVDVKA